MTWGNPVLPSPGIWVLLRIEELGVRRLKLLVRSAGGGGHLVHVLSHSHLGACVAVWVCGYVGV